MLLLECLILSKYIFLIIKFVLKINLSRIWWEFSFCSLLLSTGLYRKTLDFFDSWFVWAFTGHTGDGGRAKKRHQAHVMKATSAVTTDQQQRQCVFVIQHRSVRPRKKKLRAGASKWTCAPFGAEKNKKKRKSPAKSHMGTNSTREYTNSSSSTGLLMMRSYSLPNIFSWCRPPVLFIYFYIVYKIFIKCGGICITSRLNVIIIIIIWNLEDYHLDFGDGTDGDDEHCDTNFNRWPCQCTTKGINNYN